MTQGATEVAGGGDPHAGAGRRGTGKGRRGTRRGLGHGGRGRSRRAGRRGQGQFAGLCGAPEDRARPRGGGNGRVGARRELYSDDVLPGAVRLLGGQGEVPAMGQQHAEHGQVCGDRRRHGPASPAFHLALTRRPHRGSPMPHRLWNDRAWPAGRFDGGFGAAAPAGARRGPTRRRGTSQNVDGSTLGDYVARSFEAGIRLSPVGRRSVGARESPSRRVFAFGGRSCENPVMTPPFRDQPRRFGQTAHASQSETRCLQSTN